MISSNDVYLADGPYVVQISNPYPVTAKIVLSVMLQPAGNDTGIDDPGTFNVIYFVSFFFLFLFSFLFVGVIIKKIRDIMIFNRLRAEYLKARALRVVSPIFEANLMDRNETLRLLTPEAEAVPIAIEYVDCDPAPVAAITFVCLGPARDGDDLLPHICFATTVASLGSDFVFPPQERTIQVIPTVAEIEMEDFPVSGQANPVHPANSEQFGPASTRYQRVQSVNSMTNGTLEQMLIQENQGLV